MSFADHAFSRTRDKAESRMMNRSCPSKMIKNLSTLVISYYSLLFNAVIRVV